MWGGAFFSLLLYSSSGVAAPLPDARPAVGSRTFVSPAVENVISTLTPLLADPDLATLFSNAWPNTLDTTVDHFTPAPNLDSFIITGDIDAMWLRDSQNQIQTYLPYAAEDPQLSALIDGLIARMARSVLIDPFANSFNYEVNGQGHQDDDRFPKMKPSVFEGKYEVDSLCSFLKLSYWHYRYQPATLDSFATETWLDAVSAVLSTIETMQKDDGQSASPPYMFGRMTEVATDTLMMYRRGPPGKTCGLTRQLFRPSDDAVTFPYNIPGNAMACVELGHVEELLAALVAAGPGGRADAAAALLAHSRRVSGPLCAALSSYLRRIPRGGDGERDGGGGVIAFEVDGTGRVHSSALMDDANLPSLLSLPLLGFMRADHPLYAATRAFVLSEENPYFYSGVAGAGVGGPHTGPRQVWPMAVAVRALSSGNATEIAACLATLLATTAGTGLMHESFDVDSPGGASFSRPWFAWANGLFGELVLQLVITHPQLVLRDDPAAVATAQAVVRVPVALQAQRDRPLFSD